MITKEQAMRLQVGDVVESNMFTNADGTPQRFRVNGACKTWKRDTRKFRVPLKRGLYEFATLTEYNCDGFGLQS